MHRTHTNFVLREKKTTTNKQISPGENHPSTPEFDTLSTLTIYLPLPYSTLLYPTLNPTPRKLAEVASWRYLF